MFRLVWVVGIRRIRPVLWLIPLLVLDPLLELTVLKLITLTLPLTLPDLPNRKGQAWHALQANSLARRRGPHNIVDRSSLGRSRSSSGARGGRRHADTRSQCPRFQDWEGLGGPGPRLALWTWSLCMAVCPMGLLAMGLAILFVILIHVLCVDSM